MSQGHTVSIGGNRLGSGNKMKAYLHNYERSTHDLSTVFRSTMATGTLVPFLNLVALPGDTFDIDLDVDVMTQPTIGPLFGSYKVQLDVFSIPVRLYQAKLHMNMLGIGRDMSTVALPQMQVQAQRPNPDEQLDNSQINPSAILAYLGIRGVGYGYVEDTNLTPIREFNAIPFLAYWDIYKNYYANKQEENGVVIHRSVLPYNPVFDFVNLYGYIDEDGGYQVGPTIMPKQYIDPPLLVQPDPTTTLQIKVTPYTGRFNTASVQFILKRNNSGGIYRVTGDDLFQVWNINPTAGLAIGSVPNMDTWDLINNNPDGMAQFLAYQYDQTNQDDNQDTEPHLFTFSLDNIDQMRAKILQWNNDAPFQVGDSTLNPYILPFESYSPDGIKYDFSNRYSQEGLAIKTFQSDLFNNWISTDLVDGPDGVSEITKIDTTGGSFTIDELNLSKKIYDMLNRIAISGGSYDDWLDAVYTHDRQRSAENPMYMGGLIRNIVFQEVVSNSATQQQPLGTLAGRGRMGSKKKGGKVIVKTDEPSYIMGIASITPNIDYSQGNTWDVNLKTMNDFHKPALDAIGFQDLITDQMAWWDTNMGEGNIVNEPQFKSAGKQPAWINYMTNVSRVYGNFADQTQQMFMVLNRRYQPRWTQFEPNPLILIQDLTTYIDPVKFNNIFADTRRDAQNFWVQIGCDIEARRKMSAKVMPNL